MVDYKRCEIPFKGFVLVLMVGLHASVWSDSQTEDRAEEFRSLLLKEISQTHSDPTQWRDLMEIRFRREFPAWQGSKHPVEVKSAPPPATLTLPLSEIRPGDTIRIEPNHWYKR